MAGLSSGAASQKATVCASHPPKQASLQKKNKKKSEVHPHQPSLTNGCGDHSSTMPQMDMAVHEAPHIASAKKRKRPTRGFASKKRACKGGKTKSAALRGKVNGNSGISEDSVGLPLIESQPTESTGQARAESGISDNGEKAIDQDHSLNQERRCSQHDDETTAQSTQTYESPRKTKVGMSKVHNRGVATSPKRSAKQQYFNASNSSHMQVVKAALHLSTVPDDMLCRDMEQNKILEFCKMHILQQQPGSLYICGCPGTGKSLLMEKVKSMAEIWANEGALAAPEILSFNCTTLVSPSDIFERILACISPSSVSKNAKSCKRAGVKKIKDALSVPAKKSTSRMLMLIIDEMDYLISRDQTILYELFELSAQTDSRCILIGISNAIDLADRFLPKLSLLCRRPVVIPFSPYTKGQVITILQQRLKVLPFKVFEPAALELCARKVSAASGDMRKALHVCRIAVELLESEMRKDSNWESEISIRNGELKLQLSPSKTLGQTRHAVCGEHLVQIHHMAGALAKTFRSAVVDIIKSLPKHQQMVLCAAVRLFRQKKKDTTLGQLNGGYLDFCKSTDMPALSAPEFSSVCRVLADQGLLNLGSSREERLRRVTLQVDQEDIVFSLQSVRFFCNHLT